MFSLFIFSLLDKNACRALTSLIFVCLFSFVFVFFSSGQNCLLGPNFSIFLLPIFFSWPSKLLDQVCSLFSFFYQDNKSITKLSARWLFSIPRDVLAIARVGPSDHEVRAGSWCLHVGIMAGSVVSLMVSRGGVTV